MAEALFPPESRNVGCCAFSDMKLQVGDRLEFQLTPTAMNPRLFTHVVGYEPGESLLVRTPFQNNLPVNVYEGQQVVVRTFSGTRAFAFLTRVQRICISPFLYLHLDFPAEVQCMVIRRNQRLPVHLLAEARGKGGWHPAMLIDLGLGGAQVECAHPLGAPGETAELRFAFPVEPLEGDVTLTVRAKILHAEPFHGAYGPTTWRHGVEFQGLGKGDRVMLQNFLFASLLHGHAP